MRRALALVLIVLFAGCVGAPDGPMRVDPVAFEALQVETQQGTFTAILFCRETPETCAFMRGLVDAGYYDGRAFGRVIPTFVIQEVDRTGGTTDQPERVVAEFGTRVMFSAGAFGIARDADPDSGGSEFFVMDHAYGTPLYGNYTAFAQVLPEGMDVVHAIARVPAVRTGPASSVAASPPGSPVYFGVHDRVPVEPVVMTRVTWTNVSLPATEAARYPLQVGETTRTDTVRATLEWPADLRAGSPSTLTWWVAPRDTSPLGMARDPEPVDLAGVTVRVEGASEAAFEAEDVDAALGRVRLAWTPGAEGAHTLRLVRGAEEIATATVVVPPA